MHDGCEIEHASDTEKYCISSATVVIYQGTVEVVKNHAVINPEAIENDNK